MASITVVVPPVTEPISLAEAKAFLVVEDSYNDSLITQLISRVRSEVESLLGRALATQTVEYVDQFSSRSTAVRALARHRHRHPIALPRGPFQSIVNVSLFDAGFWLETTDYTLIEGEPANVYLARNDTPYKIRYVAGYDSPPLEVLQAVYELLAYRYANREGGPIPGSIMAVIGANRVRL